MEEKIFVGNRFDFEIEKNIYSRNATLREYVSGCRGKWDFITLADYDVIFSNGGADVIERYKQHLVQQLDEIKPYAERWQFEQNMPYAIKEFSEHVSNLKREYDSATEFVPKEAFQVKQTEHGFILEVDSKLLSDAIEVLTKVYAVTPKQKQLYKISNKISDLFREAKELANLPMLKITEIVKENGDINTDSIYYTFQNL